MKKIINVRLPCLMAAALVIGIVVAFVFEFYGIKREWAFVGVGVAALLISIAGLCAKSPRPAVFIALTFCAFFVGLVFCGYMRIDAYLKEEVVDGNYFVEGSVENVIELDDCLIVVIGDVKLNEKKSVSGKVVATIKSDAPNVIEVGVKIKFLSELKLAQELFSYGNVSYSAIRGYKYKCDVADGLVVTGDASFFARVRGRVRETLFSNLEYEAAAICYAMIVGDTSEIEYNTLRSFRYGGIAHVFAVSGLHIGLVYLVINKLLKKAVVNGQIAAVLSVAVVFLYAGVCGFTLSSLRAAIMCGIAAAARIFRKKYDGLNSLAYAVTLILIIKPFSLFSLGFQLSACAVLGICFCSRSIADFFKLIKTPKPISSAVGASLGAGAGTLPVMSLGFGYVSGVGLCMNVLIMPLISALFYLLFCGVAISAAFPAIASLCVPVAALPMEAVISLFLSCGFEKAIFGGFGAGVFMPLYYIGLLAVSDKINFTRVARISAIICSVSVLFAVTVVNTYRLFGGYEVIVASSSNSNNVLIKSLGGTVLVTNSLCDESARAVLNRNYALYPDAVVVVGGSDALFAFSEDEIKCELIYSYNDMGDIQPYPFTTVRYKNKFTVCDVEFEYIGADNLVVRCGEIIVGISGAKGSKIDDCDLFISVNRKNAASAKYNVFFDVKNAQYSNYRQGDLAFEIKNGKLMLLTRLGKLQYLD